MCCARFRWSLLGVVQLCLSLLFPASSRAGGGPEGVFIVANSRSWASQTIANHFAELRQIPPSHILNLDWPYSTDMVDVGTFREKLLLPVLGAIQQRGIGPQIDYLVFSSDFPWKIDFKALLGSQQAPPQYNPIGSITSLTYFASMVMRADFRFVLPEANNYFRRPDAEHPDTPSQGFRGWYGFDEKGKMVEGGGATYLLSTMLGVTSNNGMSVEEVVAYLKRSATADGTKPKGTIYFCRTGDVHRSGTREPVFTSAAAHLKKLGVNAEIVTGKLPVGKKDVAGLLTGTRNFDWKASQSAILPGAICENFTSYGGIFEFNDGQQRLTDFLRAGAAGSSGTVIEPFALAAKFPSAFVQVHYARGCSLAEAFYQSTASPYQLIVVGDPLCRPWATIPTVTVDRLTPQGTLRGKVILHPAGEVNGKPLDRFELFVDGMQAARCAANDTLEFDTANFPDGAAEIRVVGIEGSHIETQGRLVVPVKFDNRKRKVELTSSAKGTATWDEPVKIEASAPGATKILLFQAMRPVGTINGEKGEIEIKPEEFGLGPVTIQARAIFDDDPKDAALSAPLALTIVPPAALPAGKLKASTKLTPGLQFKADGDALLVVPATNQKKWLEDTKVKPDQSFILAAIFDVPVDGVYQFELKYVGPLTLKIDGKTVHDEKQKEPLWNYVPLALKAGHHRFELRAKGGQPDGLEIRFGRDGVVDLDGKQFRHP